MRTLLILAGGAGLAIGGAAPAQRVVTRGPGASYPMPGHAPVIRPAPMRPATPATPATVGGAGRWGSKVNGRWWGGANAPGGWAAYRRPVRGYALPPYWLAPRFAISDWQAYRLRAPAAGYGWVRYYDDAVLVDSRGSVWDQYHDVDWDRYEGGYADGRVAGGRRDDGLGGAAIGAVAGGVAGNLIAGRGNRLGGTLIGAGVGAAAGYAIDKAEDRAEDRGRHDYPPVAPDYPPPPPGYPAMGGPPVWTSPDGRTTVTTSTGGWGGSTTTVVVQSAPVVTTTVTEEIVEDHVTYTRPTVRHRKPMRSKLIRTKTRARCAC